jgi:hypothetical protein
MPRKIPQRLRPVRRVTLRELSWADPDGGRPGALTLELKLEDRGRVYVLHAAPKDAVVLLEFLARSREVRVDLGRRPGARCGPPAGWAEASLMQT